MNHETTIDQDLFTTIDQDMFDQILDMPKTLKPNRHVDRILQSADYSALIRKKLKDDAAKNRSDAINRHLFSDQEKLAQLTTDLWVARATNLILVLIMGTLGFARLFG